MNRRMIISALALALFAPAMAAQAAPGSNPPVQVTGIQVTNLVQNPNQLNQLIATATMTLDIAGNEVTRIVNFPVTLAGLPNPKGPCPILHLSLGPINLDLLGLIVNLDNCKNGPITVDITAVPGPGNLLGNLLCDVAGLLNGGLNLSQVLAALNAQQITALESGLTNLLNQVLDTALATAKATGPGQPTQGSCPILDLMVGAIHLDLLGLNVDTSKICLDISAQPGPGALLGNLLCNLVDLLNNPVKNASAINALLGIIDQVLGGLPRL